MLTVVNLLLQCASSIMMYNRRCIDIVLVLARVDLIFEGVNLILFLHLQGINFHSILKSCFYICRKYFDMILF